MTVRLPAPVQNIKAVALDIGNVLYFDDSSDCAFLGLYFERLRSVESELTVEEFLLGYTSMGSLDQKLWLEQIGTKILGARWKEIADACWATVTHHWAELTRWIPHSIAAVQYLATTYKVAILANQPSECLGVLTTSGLTSFLHPIGIDTLLGFSKPDRRAFSWLQQELNLKYSEILFVGDSLLNDIQPALDAGMNAAWIRPSLSRAWSECGNSWEAAYYRHIDKLLANIPSQIDTRALWQGSNLHELSRYLLRSGNDYRYFCL